MVDGQGFPVYSRILKGNQSEPETLKDVLDELEKRDDPILLNNKPTLIMDRGIATKDNMALIRAYGYIPTPSLNGVLWKRPMPQPLKN